MDLSTIHTLYFSPTHTTRKVISAIAEGAGLPVQAHDLTLPESEPEVDELDTSDLAILGAPVYMGRLPGPAARRLARVRGNGTPAILVVSYGNRAFEDALAELYDLAKDQGFVPVAAGAFVGQHSFSTDQTPVAHGRPDKADLDTARALGASVLDKLHRAGQAKDAALDQVPGDRPYRDATVIPDDAPITLPDLCTLCGTCADMCPVGAITVADTVTTDARPCIWCSACVRFCPDQARVWDLPMIDQARARLIANCSQPKPPQTFGV